MANFLITGVTSGIGMGTCIKLLEEGHRVLGIGRNRDSIVDVINKFGPNKCVFYRYDFANNTDVESVFLDFLAKHGKLDGMVHCAGIDEVLPLSLYTREKVDRIFQINIQSAIELLRVFSKKKISNEGASVIMLSSVMGVLGQVGKVAYCSTKAAILGLVKAAALELAKKGLRVNAVSPGIVKTPLTEKLFSSLPESNIEKIEAMHPLGFGEVEDVIPMILFLLSTQSRWITGQNFIIDGGYSIQ